MDGKLHVVPVTYGQHGETAFSPIASALVSELVTKEIASYLTDRSHRTSSGVFVFDTRSNELAFETLLPDSMCSICGDQLAGTLPPNLPFTGNEPILEKPNPVVLHTAEAENLTEALQQRYFSTHTGLVKEIQLDLQSPFGASSFDLPLKWKKKEPAIGRSASFYKSKGIAILEALERYTGWYRGGRREVIRATYESISEQAIYPLSLGVHPDECYSLPDYIYKPFRPDMPIDWVWGYSFTLNKPLLVPERCAFYGYNPEKTVSFIYETSNGCAVGSSTEEAIISGLLELVERDSFLMTWYRKLALPELSTADIPNQEVQALLKKAELFTDCRFRIFLSTMEHGIPSLWLMAISRLEEGPSIIANGGAHLDLLQALKGALYELTGAILKTRNTYQEGRTRALPMLDDPSLVREMEDHTLVNCLPEARERFAFLLNREEEPLPFEAARARVQPAPRDLRQDLEFLVQQLARVGLDVIVVDQTMPELQAGGFVCVKVIVPGLLPITFGHRYRRVEHLPRLTSDALLPMYKSTLCSNDEIGMLPHPFP
jgi:ribosomal protein S12 methylthiotransferase accessory factor